MDPAKFVFVDPTLRRWKSIRRFLFGLSAVATFLLIVLIFSVLIHPVVQRLKRTLPNHHAANSAAKRRHRPMHARTTAFQAIRGVPRGIGGLSSPMSEARRVELSAFYVNAGDAPYSSLRMHAAGIHALYPQWLFLEDAQGNVELREDSRVMGLAEDYPELKIIPLVINYDVKKGRWMNHEINAALNNAPARRRLLVNLLKVVRDEKYHGLMVDFEYIAVRSRQNYIRFLRELAVALHNERKTMAVSVEFDRPESINYQALGKLADQVVLMAYDEHADTTEAGPICALPWFTNILDQRLKVLNPTKVTIAIGHYGYDWAGHSHHPRSLGFNEVMQLALDNGASIEMDPESLNPFFDYTDAHGVDHEVWYMDAVTTYNEMQAALSRGVNAYALWRLGIEDGGYWGLEDIGIPADVAQTLTAIAPPPQLDYEGSGEMISVEAEADGGRRRLVWDHRLPLISSYTIEDYPNAWTLARSGFAKNKLAITFDDGPDPEYTPQILNILKYYDVHATFFVIGLNAQDERNLVLREFREGHEIGNHTFTHPNIADIPTKQLEVELNFTQRLLEAILGRSSILFRPPFNTDAEPATPDEAKTISVVTKMGYITVGSNIDPEDYLRPGLDRIVTGTLSQLNSGNILLLHDGGGDRSETVAALPIIIKQVRKLGYQIVPLSSLLGKSREDLMPPVRGSQRYMRLANDVSFSFGQLFMRGSRWGLIVGVSLGVLQFLIYSIMAIIQRRQKPKGGQSPLPTVDVIVPAHNEEKVVAFTIQSLIQSEGADFRIIVVDDGSTDGTLAVLQRAFGGHPRIQIITQPNMGKAAALNTGIRLSTAEVVITLDSDTIFDPHCILELREQFRDPTVTAVSGNAKVGNRINILTRWQALEYITTQNFIRRANALINCITVVPGAVGAWRRTMLDRIGGYHGDTLAEDGELTIRVLKAGGKIVYADRAVAWTEAPQNLKSLFRQRFRWMYGTFQTVWKHRKLTFNSKYGALGWIAMPNAIVFQILFPFTAPLMDLGMFFSLVFFFAQRAYHPTDFVVDEFKHTLFFYSLFLLLDIVTATLSILMERDKEEWSLLAWLPWQRLFYRQLNHVIAIRSMFTAMKGKAVGWGHITRNATHLQYLSAGRVAVKMIAGPDDFMKSDVPA